LEPENSGPDRDPAAASCPRSGHGNRHFSGNRPVSPPGRGRADPPPRAAIEGGLVPPGQGKAGRRRPGRPGRLPARDVA